MKAIKLFSIVITLCLIFLSGCATVNKNSEKEAADINSQYKAGNIQGALQTLDTTFDKDSYLTAKDKVRKDTIYFLEKGTFLSNLGPSKLNESTQNFLVARNVIKDWENRTALSFGMDLSQLKAAVAEQGQMSQIYVPRDYEKSMVGFELITNHALAKRYELALPEAKNTTELDAFLNRARKMEFEVANAKARDEMATNKNEVRVDTTRVDQIAGYPVETFNTKEVLALKNSYQNAGTYYLAGFIGEAMSSTDPAFAATSYQMAFNINPNNFFKQAITNVAKKPKPNTKQSDTLIIVDTGFLSDIYSFKVTIPFATRSGIKAVTWVVPAIKNNQIYFDPQKIEVSSQSLPLTNVANVEAMSRRELKDRMPGYIAAAITSSIIQIVTQEVAAQAIDRGTKDKNGNQSLLGGLLKLGSSIAVNTLAAGDVDTRMWKALPSSVYMARGILQQGDNTLTIQTPAGPKQVKVNLSMPYEVVKLRVFNSGVVVSNYPKPLSENEYGVFGPATVLK